MTTRRTFLLKVVPAAAAVTVLGTKAVAAPNKNKCEAGQPKWDNAQKFGYVTDASKVTNKPKKDTNQSCANCTQYNAKETSKAAVGSCKLFSECGVVEAKGWCKQWAKNPKA